MFTVNLPIKIIDNKLFFQQVEWPQRCACCGQDHKNQVHAISYHLQTSYTDTGIYKSESGFNVGFAVPYCSACQAHAAPALNIQIYIYLLGFALWVLVGWVLFINDLADAPLGIVVFLVSAALIGGGCYLLSKPLVNRFSTSRMKDTCVNNGFAISVHAAMTNIRFLFYSEEYALDFAKLNGLA